MRLNPTPTEYSTRHTPLFEAAYDRLVRVYPGVEDAFDNLDEDLRKRPLTAGGRLPVFPDRELFVTHTTSRVVRIPGLRVLYEVDGKVVVCWCVSERKTNVGQPAASIHTLRPRGR